MADETETPARRSRRQKSAAELCFELPSAFGAQVTAALSQKQLKAVTAGEAREIMSACSVCAAEVARIVQRAVNETSSEAE